MFISGLSISGVKSNEAADLFCLDMLEKWLCGFLPVSQRVLFLFHTCRSASSSLSLLKLLSRNKI